MENAVSDPNRQRLFMNFNDSQRFASPSDTRNFPTTPSTFPQPVFAAQGQGGQQQQQQYQNAYPQASAGYFAGNGQYGNSPGGANLQPMQQQQQQQQQYPQQSYQRVNTGDAANGLAHQLSHQNLGGASRQDQYRQASSPHRPRTAGSSGGGGYQQQGYQSYSSQQAPPMPILEFVPTPERNPDKYGASTHNNQKRCAQLAADFFKDSVKRARERNMRQNEMEQKLMDPGMSQARKEQAWANQGRQEAKYLRFLRTKDKEENYKTLKIIGKGAFGEVKLVQKKTDGRVYAMKSLVKTEMFQRDQLAHVRAERDILAESDSPWVVKLYTTFQDQNFLYMLMEFLPGGDLMTMLIKYEIFSEDITRFYIAEIVLAIEAVHKLGFIHRDIKPDNILLDRGGHVKLTDFGLSTGFHKLHDNSYYAQLLQKPAKPANKARDRMSVNLDQINLTVSNRAVINDWRKSRRVMAYSTVGTPDYIAPEIFTGTGYSFDCDWWSLGTIMFECQIGWPPFCAADQHDTYRKIVNWRQTLHFPDDIQLGAQAEDLIRSLIVNSENRLGRGGADEIKGHAFFHGVNFDTLRRIRAPFEPRLQSATDTAYFPMDDIPQTAMSTLLKAAQSAGHVQEEGPEMELPFLGYTYKRFDTFNQR